MYVELHAAQWKDLVFANHTLFCNTTEYVQYILHDKENTLQVLRGTHVNRIASFKRNYFC